MDPEISLGKFDRFEDMNILDYEDIKDKIIELERRKLSPSEKDWMIKIEEQIRYYTEIIERYKKIFGHRARNREPFSFF